MFTSCGALGARTCARPRRSNSRLFALRQTLEFKPYPTNKQKTYRKGRYFCLAEEERFELSHQVSPV